MILKFEFVDTLGKVKSFDTDQILSIHSPPHNDNVSLIQIAPDQVYGMRFDGSYERADVLIERYNNLVPFNDRLIYITEVWKNLKYHAVKDGSEEMLAQKYALCRSGKASKT